ncbi:MAG: alpha/beta hydrolase [Rhodospirillaceae bacterium]
MCADKANAVTLPRISYLDLPDGSNIRHALWQTASGEARGTVVLLTGRTEYLEKYQEFAEDWLARGFRVFSFDWRGQGLSSRFLTDHMKGHVPDYSYFVGDLSLWLDKIVKPAETGPTVLFAHSMGGLIALRYLTEHPARFAAVVLSAPMVDINTGSWPRFAAEMVSRMAGAFGFRESYAFGQHDYDPATDAIFQDNAVSSNPLRFKRIHDGFAVNPELKLGGVTFGWLIASFRAQALAAMPGALQDLRAPVLILAPEDDRLIPIDSQLVACRRLHDCTAITYPGARHDITAERDEIRAKAWRDIDAFLTRALAAGK